jgi:hypothetical protein
MSNPIRSSTFKSLQGIFNRIPLLLNQPSANDKSSPIKSIMTMYTDFRIFDTLYLAVSETSFYNGDETADIFFCRWYFCGGGEFMVCYGCAVEGIGVV